MGVGAQRTPTRGSVQGGRECPPGEIRAPPPALNGSCRATFRERAGWKDRACFTGLSLERNCKKSVPEAPAQNGIPKSRFTSSSKGHRERQRDDGCEGHAVGHEQELEDGQADIAVPESGQRQLLGVSIMMASQAPVARWGVQLAAGVFGVAAYSIATRVPWRLSGRAALGATSCRAPSRWRLSSVQLGWFRSAA